MAALVVVASITGEHDARAEEPKVDYADGVLECHNFAERNARERAEFEKQQPATPYKYPREDDVLGAPWGAFLKSIGGNWPLFLATIIPSFGAQLRADTPAALIAWPMQIPLGPAY